MKEAKISIAVLAIATMLTACGGGDDAEASSGTGCSLVSTVDGTPLNIKVTAEDSE